MPQPITRAQDLLAQHARYRRALSLTASVRAAQTEYFRTRAVSALGHARSLEGKLDKALAALGIKAREPEPAAPDGTGLAAAGLAGHSAAAVAAARAAGEIGLAEDGFYYYVPGSRGMRSAYALRAIADYLDAVNAEWGEEVDKGAARAMQEAAAEDAAGGAASASLWPSGE